MSKRQRGVTVTSSVAILGSSGSRFMGWIRGMVMAHFALVLAKTNGCHKTGKYLIVRPRRESEKCKMRNTRAAAANQCH